MAVVTLKVGGRDYQVACNDGEEERLRLLADEVDDRARTFLFQMKNNPSEAMGLLMAALTLADELLETKREMQKSAAPDQRVVEMEAAVALTLDEIATRIEKIADQIEVR